MSNIDPKALMWAGAAFLLGLAVPHVSYLLDWGALWRLVCLSGA